MKSPAPVILGTFTLLLSAVVSLGEVRVVIDHNSNSEASAGFKFKRVPPPSKNGAAAKAKFSILEGERDSNGAELDALHDGKLPTEEDQPSENFFFAAGSEGGRLLVDLGSVIEVKQVNTYSWHPSTRGPQVYVLYAGAGASPDFKPQPAKGADLAKAGWQLLAKVDTRPKDGEPGGQYGVSISDSQGVLGQFRYLLFDISRTEDSDDFGNTFLSEIDVLDRNSKPEQAQTAVASDQSGKETVQAADGACEILLDTSETPDLSEWAHAQLAPMVKEWYPKIVKLLPSDGFEAPKTLSIRFSKTMQGVAATGGTRITCGAGWFRQNLKGEALGAVFHEMVHVVQRYGRVARDNPNAVRPPGWLVEGIPDYIRWYTFEPQSHGAEITRRNIARARYDASYRISANFLNWVVEKYDKDLIAPLNAALRQGQYTTDLWKQRTGHTVEELGDEWKAAIEKKVAAEAPSAASASESAGSQGQPNTLTDAEKAADWKLLFNGRDFTGWHNFKREGVRPGWQVQDGALVCSDPHTAGDIVTADKFQWFELQLDYNISVAGNSGIMYHVTDEGNAVWATGPEFQLEDNQAAADPVRCGWLYALYQPPNDPNTGKPLDATKPVGQWNHVRLLISPDKCAHEINGVKYFEYVLGSDDFNSRVAKSKFARMPRFAKSDTGCIALQGDHGQVSFRNIKIRIIEPK